MSLLLSPMAKNSSAGFYNGVATQSLRFDDGSSAYLTRTPSSAGNRKTWTWSCWIKRTNLGSNSIFEGGTASNNSLGLQFDNSSKSLQFFVYDGSSVTVDVKTTQVFRDVSAWYHIVIAFDTTQGTASNRVKLYVNGSQITDLATTTYPSENTDFNINNTNAHQIGRSVFGSSNHFDGYMTEVNFVDGTALAPSSFGETKNGVWIAKKYTGSYGTNGFRLQFNQTGTGTASTSTIGADTSGNTHHFTSSGIDASDCAMPDSPENNFATMNPLHFRATYGMATMSQGNLFYGSAGLSSSFGASFTTFTLSSGKWYAEVLTNGTADPGFLSCSAGVMNVGHYGYQHFLVQNPQNQTGNWTLFMDGTDTVSRFNGSLADPTFTGYNDDKVLGIALNADDKELSFYVDGALQTGLGSSGIIDISTGGSANDAWSFTANTANGLTTKHCWNFGQDSSFAGDETATSNSDSNGNGTFHTAPPSGFLAVCSANLPEPTISPNADTQSDDYFNTVLYSGTNGTNNVSGVGFQPDWVWIKRRDASAFHPIHDSSRPTYAYLRTSGNNAENTDSGSDWFRSFDSDGFTVVHTSTGSGTTGQWNQSGGTFLGWNWKANGGTTTTNDASSTGVGTLDSVFQANTTARFSIVTYTGFGETVKTIAHGLGVIPQMILFKSRGAAGAWHVYHQSTGNTKALYLNATDGETTDNNFLNQVTPTDTLITLGTGSGANPENVTMVAYCFAEVEGYSKIGSYIGNSNGDGTFVFTGFKPAWVMLKRSDSNTNGSWVILDNKRDATPNGNPNDTPLFPDGAFVEENNTNRVVDFLSNGFKLRSATTNDILNVGTMIYMAFAEAPFKYANAR